MTLSLERNMITVTVVINEYSEVSVYSCAKKAKQSVQKICEKRAKFWHGKDWNNLTKEEKQWAIDNESDGFDIITRKVKQ